MIVNRPRYLDALIERQGNGLVKLVTGVRRCGKSFLLFTLFKHHLIETGVPKTNIIEMAFDEFETRDMRDPHTFYPWVKDHLPSNGACYLLLDEIQLLESFEEVLIGLSRIEGVDIYATGSNAKLLSSDIITEFRGRGDEIRMWPLSFSEFRSVWQGNEQRCYENYSVYGGMPATLSMNDSAKAAYLQSIFSEIYLNDIIERNALRNAEGLETLLDVLSSDIGSLTNPKKSLTHSRAMDSNSHPTPCVPILRHCAMRSSLRKQNALISKEENTSVPLSSTIFATLARVTRA